MENDTSAGRMSVSSTTGPGAVPAWLVTVRAYASSAPAMTGSGESVFVTDRSAQGRMVVLAWAPLLLGSRSGGEPDVTVAVLMAVVPHAAALTTLMVIRTWAVPPDGSDVAVQVTSSPDPAPGPLTQL